MNLVCGNLFLRSPLDRAKNYARQIIWRSDSAITRGEDAAHAPENQADG
jgi:hypothetical protein